MEKAERRKGSIKMNQLFNTNWLCLFFMIIIAMGVSVALILFLRHWANEAELSHVIVNNKPFEIIERY